ncbi:hypothetical protein VNO77_04509 [Canavalia gladiata]|uniref:Uncharacterized protein n=1 Tax=Canavalia gladiata TaxID=3824 RepID=A0AAN9N1R6_CANGL
MGMEMRSVEFWKMVAKRVPWEKQNENGIEWERKKGIWEVLNSPFGVPYTGIPLLQGEGPRLENGVHSNLMGGLKKGKKIDTREILQYFSPRGTKVWSSSRTASLRPRSGGFSVKLALQGINLFLLKL